MSKKYNGEDIFKLVDTYGLPLDIINMMLRERNAFFNAEEFILAAKKAGWKNNRIYHMMLGASPLSGERVEELKTKLHNCIYT